MHDGLKEDELVACQHPKSIAFLVSAAGVKYCWEEAGMAVYKAGGGGDDGDER